MVGRKALAQTSLCPCRFRAARPSRLLAQCRRGLWTQPSDAFKHGVMDYRRSRMEPRCCGQRSALPRFSTFRSSLCIWLSASLARPDSNADKRLRHEPMEVEERG